MMRKLRPILFIVFASGLFALFLFGKWYSGGVSDQEIYYGEGTDARVFAVREGEGVLDIAQRLEQEGFITNRFLFLLYVGSKGKYDSLRAGGYLLQKNLSIPEIARMMWEGNVVAARATIPEGFTLIQIEGRLLAGGVKGEKGELARIAAAEFKDGYEFLEDVPENRSLEGFLFPDTYDIPYGFSLKDAARLMLDNFDRKVSSDLRREIGRQGRTMYDAVTMASMIEREVAGAADRRVVSGILWKRLENGVPLQADATIAYITGKRTTKISKEETETDSPYNTYIYAGLPVGPIGNPGLESIFAALYPEESDFWYYLSTPEGETIFSRTLEEHNGAKAKYLR